MVFCVCKCKQLFAFANEGIGMKRTTLPNTIGYRVSEEQWRRFEEEAEQDGISVHDWCREAALEKLNNLGDAAEKSPPAETRNGTGRVADERALLEELARIGYLIEHGFGIQLSADRATDAEWRRREKESKSIGARLVKMMFERRAKGAGTG
jgi:hypothetical protein